MRRLRLYIPGHKREPEAPLMDLLSWVVFIIAFSLVNLPLAYVYAYIISEYFPELASDLSRYLRWTFWSAFYNLKLEVHYRLAVWRAGRGKYEAAEKHWKEFDKLLEQRHRKFCEIYFELCGGDP